MGPEYKPSELYSGASISTGSKAIASGKKALAIAYHQQVYISSPSKTILSPEKLKQLAEQFKQLLRKHYASQGAMKRLFIEKSYISLETCYINLSIMHKIESHDEKKIIGAPGGEEKTFRDERLETYETLHNIEHSKIILPEDLFNQEIERESAKTEKPISRLLILGRAGIGKSTLCRYLAYQWAKDNLWKEEQKEHGRFKVLIWIPLRELSAYAIRSERQRKELSIGGFLCQQRDLGAVLKEAELTVDVIDRLLLLKELTATTLFILDGYDEIANLPEEGENRHPVWPLIDILKNEPQWIITSRSYQVKALNVDRELEVMGFVDKNIEEYVQGYFCKPEDPKETEKGNQLVGYLKQNRAIWGIAHIPIQLEFVCFVWSREYYSKAIEPPDITMTMLYSRLHRHLLHRYLVNSVGQRRYPSKEPYELENDFPLKLQKMVSTIGAIALRGLITQQLLIPSNLISDVLNEYKEFFFKEVVEVGLLKGTGEQEDDFKDYYFLHLSFQEYYAALHIVEAFVGDSIWYLTNYKKSKGEIPYPTVESFIQRHKYDIQYEIVWCFVSGLLAEHGQEHARRFFDLLDEAPRDALGFRHTVLLIRLLEECFTKDGHIGLPEKDYHKWVETASTYTQKIALYHGREGLEEGARQLARSIGLSPRLMKEITLLNPLKSFPPNYNVISFYSLLGSCRIIFAEELIDTLIQALYDKDEDICMAAAEALRKQSILSQKTHTALIEALSDKDRDMRVRRAIAKDIFGKQSNLSEEAQIALMQALRDENVGQYAALILINHGKLSSNTQIALMELLDSSEEYVRWVAVQTLGNYANLSTKAQISLMEVLSNEKEDLPMRKTAAKALGKQSDLSQTAQDALIQVLSNEKEDLPMRKAVAEVLGKQSDLSQAAQDALMKVLSNKNREVWWAIVSALGQQGNLSAEVRVILIQALWDSDEKMRQTTVSALGQQRNLNAEVQAILIRALWDSDKDVRKAATETLGKQNNLSQKTQTALIKSLSDEDEDVRSAAAQTLGKQGNLNAKVLSLLIQSLRDENEFRYSATEALRQQGNLSPKALLLLIQALHDKDVRVRNAATEALRKQSNLSAEAQAALIPALRDKDVHVSNAAIEALGKQSNLSTETQAALIPALRDQDKTMFRLIPELSDENGNVAAKILGMRSHLGRGVQAALIQVLRDHYPLARMFIVEVLGKQSNLSVEAQIALIQALSDEDGDVGRIAAEILNRRSNLSTKAQAALIKALNAEKLSVYRAAVEILGKQDNLSTEVQVAMVQALQDKKNENVYRTTLQILRKQNIALLVQYYQTVGPEQHDSTSIAIVIICTLKVIPICFDESDNVTFYENDKSFRFEKEKAASLKKALKAFSEKLGLLDIYSELVQPKVQSLDKSIEILKLKQERSSGVGEECVRHPDIHNEPIQPPLQSPRRCPDSLFGKSNQKSSFSEKIGAIDQIRGDDSDEKSESRSKRKHCVLM